MIRNLVSNVNPLLSWHASDSDLSGRGGPTVDISGQRIPCMYSGLPGNRSSLVAKGIPNEIDRHCAARED